MYSDSDVALEHQNPITHRRRVTPRNNTIVNLTFMIRYMQCLGIAKKAQSNATLLRVKLRVQINYLIYHKFARYTLLQHLSQSENRFSNAASAECQNVRP